MRDESLIIGGATYVPSKVAALRVRIVPDYATRLARLGLVRGIRHKGAWYIDPENLDEFMRERTARFADIRNMMSRARKDDLKRYELESVLSSEQHTPALTLPPPALAAFHAKGIRQRIFVIRFAAIMAISGVVLASPFLLPASARTALVASVSVPEHSFNRVSEVLRSIVCQLSETCGPQIVRENIPTDRQAAATAVAVVTPVSSERTAAATSADSADDYTTGTDPRTIVTRIVTSAQPQSVTEFPSGLTPLSITQSLARQLASLTSLIQLQQHPPAFPQQVAGAGITGPALGGFILGPAVGSGSSGSSGSSSSGSVAAASITGTITNAINSASAAIASLTGSDLTYVRAAFTEATTTYLSVTGSASFSSLTATGTASLATTTISGDLSVTGTTTVDKLTVSSLDCTGYGNGGKLTTDASGNVTCAADQGGAGSTVGGSTNQVQYNDFGAFGASSAFTFSTTSARLSVTNASTTVRFGNSGVTGQFLWDGTNGKLGLGTSTPWQLLSVASTVATNAILPNGPYTTNLSAYDLGATGQRWNALWAGTLNVGTSTFSLAADSSSNLGIYTAASAGGTKALSIAATGFATTTLSGLAISGSATSTSNVGFNLIGGCFSINNVCVGGSAGGITSLQQTYGSAQTGAITLATSSAATSNGVTVGGTITNSGGTFTWTPTVSVASIPNAALANSTISGVALGNSLSNITFNSAGTGAASGSTYNGSGALTISYNSIGAQPAGSYLTGNQTITLSGDVTGSGATAITTTLATVNTNTGSFGSSSAIPTFTVNGKGLITAAGTAAVVAPAGTLTGNTLASGVTASSLTSVGTLTSLSVTGDVSVGAGSCFRVNGVCIGYTVKLAAVYATSTAGTTTVQFTGAQGSAPSHSAGSPGTLTLPSNASSIVAEVWGGGGGVLRVMAWAELAGAEEEEELMD